MKKESLQDVIERLEDQDYVIQTDYSGRFMYGEECLAVEIESIEQLFSLGALLYDHQEELGSVKIDQLGLGYIAYFPKVITNGIKNQVIE